MASLEKEGTLVNFQQDETASELEIVKFFGLQKISSVFQEPSKETDAEGMSNVDLL